MTRGRDHTVEFFGGPMDGEWRTIEATQTTIKVAFCPTDEEYMQSVTRTGVYRVQGSRAEWEGVRVERA